MGRLVASVVDLDKPGTYLHWSIFQVSVANLVVIAVMVALFGLALVLPFPGHRGRGGDASGDPGDGSDGDGSAAPVGPGPVDSDEGWTGATRRRLLAVLPPGKLLPDRQPAYVASWVYVFGVATLAALAVVVVSGFALALGGTDWWHTDAVGHFFNSLHLWSVELFMAFMVIHLWGKFWMAAWRGRRALTWITGVVAFAASVLECFTGYLSQQNFDSQWIATNGKDAINSVGLGAFFNLMNFGQMLLWHVVLVPMVLLALVGAHILLVRMRGVVPPLPRAARGGRPSRRSAAGAWRGPTRPYDLLKEATAAVLVVAVLVVALASLLSSPDVPPVSVRSWATVAPADFLATATTELNGTSETAQYGPPYTSGNANLQRIGVSWQSIAGIRQPIDTASAFVLQPLAAAAPTDPTLAVALRRWGGAPARQQQAWAAAYLKDVQRVRFVGGQPRLPAGAYGPVATLVGTELALARSGAVDTDLLAARQFYGTNFTKPLLFLEDGSYFAAQATAEHLTGSQWGVMNETGSYPGQPWLWLYQLWYQIQPFSSSANVDLIAIYLTGLATILLLAVPFIPGLRDLPRWIPVHRLVWRDWNARGDEAGPGRPEPTPSRTEPGVPTPAP